MEGNKRVYSKPDLAVMYYTPSDVAAGNCAYTANSSSGACLIGGQSSESFSGTYYIGTYDGVTYIIWSYNYAGSAPDQSLVSKYKDYIESIYYSKTGSTLSSTQGWHIAVYNSAGWSGNAS